MNALYVMSNDNKKAFSFSSCDIKCGLRRALGPQGKELRRQKLRAIARARRTEQERGGRTVLCGWQCELSAELRESVKSNQELLLNQQQIIVRG